MSQSIKAKTYTELCQHLSISFTKEVLRVCIKYIKKHPKVLQEEDIDDAKQIMCQAIIGKDYTPIMPSLDVTTSASGGRTIGDIRIFDEDSTELMWENMYDRIMNPKWKKNTRNFSRIITGNPVAKDKEAPIFIVPRIRGVSYLNTPLKDMSNENVQFCPISKGFPMQDVSSFTLGPVQGEGLNVVNSAFSKSITVAHIEGGGHVDLSRKCYWKRSQKPTREIAMISDEFMKVDGKKCNIHKWLSKHEDLWLEEWQIWRKSIALSSEGGFKWTEGLDDTIAYRNGSRYLNFVQWKLDCYIRPAYDLMVKTEVYKFLELLHKKKRIPLGLVHPMGTKNEIEEPITKEYIIDMILSPTEMTCMPYLVAGRLLGVSIPPIQKE